MANTKLKVSQLQATTSVGSPGVDTLIPTEKAVRTAIGAGATDANAIHVNASSEISGLTAKTTPADNDMAVIEDSAAANVKKKVLWSAIKATLKTYFDGIYTGVGAVTNYGLAQGRLTLTTGVPVTTADVTAATTLYYTPYGGDQIGLYDGVSAWAMVNFAETSLDISAYTANKNYDIWAYNNSGTLALDSTVWTDDSTRATALAFQNGIYVKTGATTRRYLGTIRITGTTGQTEDSGTKRFVWNHYNRSLKPSKITPYSGTNTYTTSSWREWNNGTSVTHYEFVYGIYDTITLSGVMNLYNSGNGHDYAYTALGVDSTSSTQFVQMNSEVTQNAVLGAHPYSFPYGAAPGYHYQTWHQYGSTNITFATIVSTNSGWF